MKRMDVPSVILIFMGILNALAIGWIISNRELLSRRTFLALLGAILIITLAMISLGEFYEYLIMENKRLRVAIVAITRIITFSGSVLGIIGAILMFYYDITFSILFSRQILDYSIMFLIGAAYISLLFVAYTLLSFISTIRMGSYQYKSEQYYRIQKFAITITQKDFMEKYHNCLKIWALYVPENQAIELFKSVVNILHDAENEIEIIAKPFAIIFPSQLDQFKEYAQSARKRKRELAIELTQKIENQISNKEENKDEIKLIQSLEEQRNNISLVKPLVEKKKIVPIEEVIDQTNLTQEKIEKACKYIDREVFDGDILTDVQYIKRLQKVL